MKEISVETTRKLGMIKASGYEVVVTYDTAAWVFIDIKVGNELVTFDEMSDLEKYVDRKYKEIVQNEFIS